MLLDEIGHFSECLLLLTYTAVSSEGRAKLRDLAVWPVRAGCYSQAALSIPRSKPIFINKSIGTIKYDQIYHFV